MTGARRFASQAMRLLAATLAARVLDLLFYVLLARALGVELFGRYAYALSFTLLFNTLGDLGLSTVVTREVARVPGRSAELVWPCLSLKLLIGLLTFAGVLGLATLGPGGHETLGLFVPLAIGMLLNSVSLLFEGLLRATGRPGRSGLGLLVQAALTLAAGSALVALRGGVAAAAAAYLAGSAGRLVVSGWWSRDLWRPGAARPAIARMAVARSAAGWRTHAGLLREALPLALSGIFIALYFRIDSVILRTLQGERAVGLYAGIYRFFEAFVMLSATFRSVLFPIMARAADRPTDALGALCRKSLRVHLMFTVGVAVFFSFHARAIVTAVLGPAYAEAAPGLAVLIWALPGSYMADTLLFLLAAHRRQALGTWAAAATALFNVAANLILVPRFSFAGCSGVTVASEWLCFALLLGFFRRGVRVPGLAAAAWRPATAGVLLAATLAATAAWRPPGLLALAASALASVVLYGFVLRALGAIGPDEMALVRGLLPARRRGRSEAARDPAV